MNFREVTVGGLLDFIQSDEYLNLEPKPVTTLRAISQAKNPAARPEDVILVYISEAGNLLAFAGLLPDELSGSTKHIYSNSGWWVHPELGRKYGMPVFLKAIQSCGNHMFLTDCTEYTKSILEKTGMFIFPEPESGQRVILRFYSGAIMLKKKVSPLVSKLFSVADTFLNFLISFRINNWRRNNLPGDYSLRSVKRIDDKLNAFIKELSSGYFLKQDGEKLNWILENPWITTKEPAQPVNYPFSHVTESFKQEILVAEKKDEPVAVIFLSVRDHHASFPYVYYIEQHLNPVLNLVLNHILESKARSLTIYNPGVLEALKRVKVPSILRMNVWRYYGYSKELTDMFPENMRFQDGEGDVAFT